MNTRAFLPPDKAPAAKATRTPAAVLVSIAVLVVVCWSASFAGTADTYELNLAQPQTGIASNTAIDVIEHDGGVWLATGKGITFSFDGGQTWFVHNKETGLPNNNVSAIFSIDGRLWTGTNRDEVINEQNFTLSDGPSYSDDNGETWTTIDFGPNGQDIPRVEGGDRTIFDFTGHVDLNFFNNVASPPRTEWVFFSAFAGGLLASQDGGINWRRIFPSAADSVQFFNQFEPPSLRNRYFSCAVDTSHGDSLYLWAGTAGGVFQYVFIPPKNKFFNDEVLALEFCDTCTDTVLANRVYIGGNYGVTTGHLGRALSTAFEVDGLPGPGISALIDIGGTVFAGTFDTTTGNSTGLAVSNDQGATYSGVTLSPDPVGADNLIADFTNMGGRLYLAAQSSGLYVSPDSGLNWSQMAIASPAADRINALATYEDTLLVGTDSGLLWLFLDPVGAIDSTRLSPFIEGDSSSSRIISVDVQPFFDSLGVLDSTAIWTVHRPVTAQGQPIVGRYSSATETWRNLQVLATTHDVAIIGDTALVLGEFGVRLTTDGSNPSTEVLVRQFSQLGSVIRTMEDDTFFVAATRGDTIIVGSNTGFAFTIGNLANWRIFRANTDGLRPDLVINHTYFTSLNFDDESFGITGDFVPALGVNYNDTGTAEVWVSGRPVDVGFNGRSVGRFIDTVITPLLVDTVTNDTLRADTSFSTRWQAVDTVNFAWNFAFRDNMRFSATSNGVFMDTGLTRINESVRLPLVDAQTGEPLINEGEGIFGIQDVDTLLWLGTSDGIVSLPLAMPTGGGSLFQKTDPSDEVYAYPTPFSPGRDLHLDFHFTVNEAGPVTLEIYDFAMNLVARPIDGVFYEAGTYPDGSSQGLTWDGRNGRGEVVAVGMYYFIVKLPSGEERWGKLAVMP